MKSICLHQKISVKLTTAVAATLLLTAFQGNAATVEPEATTEVSGERSGVSFSGRLGVGYLTGEAHEYVYWPVEGGHTASELTWDIDSVYMFGLGGSVQALSWLNVHGDLWLNIGDGSGYMEDYDWQVLGMPWTDRSEHTNTDVTRAIMFDINAEMTMYSTPSVSFTGFVGFRRDSFEWEARGGSYLYSVNEFRDTAGTIAPDSLGITYEQIFNAPYLGIGLSGDFDRIHLAAKITGSVFVGGEATDNHHLRDLVVVDGFSGENMWAVDLSFGYDVSDSLGITASYFYEKYDTMTGDSQWNFNSEGYSENLSDAAGASLETSMFSMILNYSF